MPSDRVRLANKVVPMRVSCRLAGMDLPEYIGSAKLPCPFEDIAHPDNEPALRVYRDSAFCFSEWLYLSPVRLCTLVWDVDEEQVADRLLAEIGWKPASYQEQWQRAQEMPVLDKQAVAAALRTRCERLAPDWVAAQYEPEVAGTLAKCLGLLPVVQSEEDARRWLDGCAVAMSACLARRHPREA